VFKGKNKEIKKQKKSKKIQLFFIQKMQKTSIISMPYGAANLTKYQFVVS
jgi:hypothetical protein